MCKVPDKEHKVRSNDRGNAHVNRVDGKEICKPSYTYDPESTFRHKGARSKDASGMGVYGALSFQCAVVLRFHLLACS